MLIDVTKRRELKQRMVGGFDIPGRKECVVVEYFGTENDIIDEGLMMSILGNLFFVKSVIWDENNEDRAHVNHYKLELVYLELYMPQEEIKAELPRQCLWTGDHVPAGSFALHY